WCRQDMGNSLSKIRGDIQVGPTCTWLAADFRSTLATNQKLNETLMAAEISYFVREPSFLLCGRMPVLHERDGSRVVVLQNGLDEEAAVVGNVRLSRNLQVRAAVDSGLKQRYGRSRRF